MRNGGLVSYICVDYALGGENCTGHHIILRPVSAIYTAQLFSTLVSILFPDKIKLIPF